MEGLFSIVVPGIAIALFVAWIGFHADKRAHDRTKPPAEHARGHKVA
jgi:hypothetical protein